MFWWVNLMYEPQTFTLTRYEVTNEILPARHVFHLCVLGVFRRERSVLRRFVLARKSCRGSSVCAASANRRGASLSPRMVQSSRQSPLIFGIGIAFRARTVTSHWTRLSCGGFADGVRVQAHSPTTL